MECQRSGRHFKKDGNQKTSKEIQSRSGPNLGNKTRGLQLRNLKSLWSLKEVGWFNVEAYGRSGGILTMLDKSSVGY